MAEKKTRKLMAALMAVLLLTAPPKTQTSLRVIPLSVKLLGALKKHKAQQDKDKLKAGPAWNDHGFIFANKLGNPIPGR